MKKNSRWKYENNLLNYNITYQCLLDGAKARLKNKNIKSETYDLNGIYVNGKI